ncbi:MAG: PD40 domain-containing protein [Verrucomicrobia bacterium]|nr:PD40 domain-containing protein [Verrucomicrobiota bacterium]
MNNNAFDADLEATALEPERPWPGLLSFTESGREFFFGRNQEIAELYRRVRNQTLTILFGQSGYGKTSLILAGLFPKLRAERFRPIRIRPDYESELSVADQVKQHIAHEFGGSANTEASLWECFHRITNPLCSAQSGQTPCLVFDQFEEIFTLGHKSGVSRSQAEAFLQELSCLVENTVPHELESELERDPESAAEFEFSRQAYRVIIVLREDYLADFEGLKRRMPAVMQNRMRLGRLTRAQALEAIRGPAARAPHPLIRLEAAHRIIDFVMGQPALETGGPSTGCAELAPAIDPALLNLLCRELNEKRLEAGEVEITEDLVRAGQQTAILANFYERELRKEPEAVRRLIEDELVTETGHRESMSLEKARSKLEKAGVSPDSLERLVQGRLLRIEDRLDRKRVEVAHDVLTEVVQRSRQMRELEDARQRAEMDRRRAEERQKLAEMRRRRASIALLVGFVIAVMVCYSFYHQLQVQKDLTARITAQAEKDLQQLNQARRRSEELFRVAKARLALENDPKKDVIALYYLSRALRFDHGNDEVTKRTCDLLSRRVWCPALSAALHADPEGALVCADWDPNGNLMVVSKDGRFLGWSGTGHELRPVGASAASRKVADSVPSVDAAKYSAGFFSPDGRQLILFSVPTAGEPTTAQIRNWSRETGSYDAILQTIALKDTVPFRRNVAWSPDGKTLAIVSVRWDHNVCQVFRSDGKLYQEIINPFGTASVAAACFSEDGKWMATESPDGNVQFWDPGTLMPATGPAEATPSFRLPPDARPRFLAFGPKKDEMVTILFDGSVKILDLRTRAITSGSLREQIMSITFSPRQANGRLAATVFHGRIAVSKAETLDQSVAEPVCFQGAYCLPRFNHDGTKLLTLSGPFWDVLDTVRVWDLRLQEPLPALVRFPVDSKSVPPWLGDLAGVVSAQWQNAEGEEVPESLDVVAKTYSAKDVTGPYAALWSRFLPFPDPSSSVPAGTEPFQTNSPGITSYRHAQND